METNNINYAQVVNQTFDEKVKMYLDTCTKEELAKMLAMRDIIEIQIADKQKQEKFNPYFPNESALPYWYSKCKTWSDCVNPHFDCVNCPLRSGIPINKKWEVTCSNSAETK